MTDQPQRPSGPYEGIKKHELMPWKRMVNRLPTGPGSRGGKWHDPEWRKEYYRLWRKAHPEYRERERQRSLKNKMDARTKRVVEGGPYERP